MLSEMPLFLFTLLGGLAAGIYGLTVIFPQKSEGKKQLVVPVVVIALLACGGIALLFHLGRPERMLLAFRNLNAGIAQEGWATMAFGIVVAIDLVLVLTKKVTPKVLRIVGAIFGLVLVVAMANAYFAISVNKALHSPVTFALFIFAAVAMGASFVGAFGESEDKERLAKVASAAGALLAVSIFLECLPFGEAGLSVIPFALAGVVAAAGIACCWLAPKKGTGFAYASFALIVVAVVVSRYGFYLAI